MITVFTRTLFTALIFFSGAAFAFAGGPVGPTAGGPGCMLQGLACTSAANSCGQTTPGVLDCGSSQEGTASYCVDKLGYADPAAHVVTPPGDPANLGNACTSSVNSCGQTGYGSIQCDGSCSATPPSCVLGVSCTVSPTTAVVGQAVTWTAGPTGGVPPYTYSWGGTDSLSGVSSIVHKTYSLAGIKYGAITVTDSSTSSAGNSYSWVHTGTSAQSCHNPLRSCQDVDFSAGCSASTAGTSFTCNGDDFNGCVATSPYFTGQTYTCKATGTSQPQTVSTQCSSNVTVGTTTPPGPNPNPDPNAPTAQLTAAPVCAIASGSSVALTWTSSNATSCTGTGFSTGGATSGTVTVPDVAPDTTFSVTCQ